MKQRTFLLLMVMGLMAFASCRDKELDMTLTQATLFQGETITAISAEDAWEIDIVQDQENQYVELEYSAFLEPYLKVVKEGEKLSIAFNTALNMPNNAEFRAVVHLKTLSDLSLTDAVSAILAGDFAEPLTTLKLDHASECKGGSFSNKLEVELDNASTIANLMFNGSECNLRVKNASFFKGDIVASWKLNAYLWDASRVITYGGTAPAANIELHSASTFNSILTRIEEMQVSLKEASEASVFVTRRLTGTLQNGSVLYYTGNPILDVQCDESSSFHILNN